MNELIRTVQQVTTFVNFSFFLRISVDMDSVVLASQPSVLLYFQHSYFFTWLICFLLKCVAEFAFFGYYYCLMYFNILICITLLN